MKTLALFSLSLAVTLGMPFAPGVEQTPVLTEREQSLPLLGDWVPVQGHVVVEDPAPQVRPRLEEQKKELAPVPVDMKQSIVEPEIKVKPQVREEQQGEVKTEIKKEPDVKAEPDVKEDLEADVEQEVNLNPEVTAEVTADVEPEVEMKPELNDDPELKVKSEIKVEPDVQEQFEAQINLKAEIEERHIDMEGKYDMGEPIMELEPLEDDNTELSEVEKSLRAAFQNQDPVNQPLPEEEGGLMSERDNVSDEEPIMELEPEDEESFYHQQVMPEAAIMEEGPALDIMGQQMSSLREYFPNEEARMGMDYGTHQDYLTDYVMMEEPGSEFIGEEKQSSMGLPEMEDGPDGGVQIGVAPKREKRALMRQGVKNHEETRSSPNQDKQGRSHCPGVTLEGKCYQFFRGPKRAADAEFFCQEHVAGGHLASITGQHIHREVMNMMLRQNGALTRSWIGGLRYLKTGRFIWLDGSHWSYADWLSGEPNNTADIEECVEVLAYGNGKFNDFTCWEPQAFICSYPH
ncbi:hypothetical protein VZT92_005385 [Zoarces viviparus]|uniref:C-type lectin domain-containing protein n=1 Tax=Zoarces viviparus TaxID=48416 RepID=A0AAW1FUS0_ZOAVI